MERLLGTPSTISVSPQAETETVELPPLSPEDVEEALSKPTVTENDVAAVVSAWTKALKQTEDFFKTTVEVLWMRAMEEKMAKIHHFEDSGVCTCQVF